MKPLINTFKKSEKENPFKDSQAKNFSNNKLVSEFCPTSNFWSLFNDQHEVLIGTRGSGKTILLRMMQYSLLRHILSPEAKNIISQKKYIALYVPTNIEFLRSINPSDLSFKSRTDFFQFGFNCFLAQTFLTELDAIAHDITSDFIEKSKLELKLSKKISSMWYPEDEILNSFKDLKFKVGSQYHNFNFHKETDLSTVPLVFSKPIGTPVQSISKHIFDDLGMDEEPKWLLCIDEADFLDENHLKCINSLFRSDSQSIVIKMATLPFRHITRETNVSGELAEPNGNDFNYRPIDFDPEGDDFKKVTNQLCENRLNKIIHEKKYVQISLEDIIGSEGNDKLIDYYKREIGDHNLTRNDIEAQIIDHLPKQSREKALKNGIGSPLNRKPVYDKYAPIFFLREMFIINNRGNSTAGFYAGPTMIRKASEGNPRIFLQIMNQLFEEARKTILEPKKQTKILLNYANHHSEVTERLPENGKDLSEFLDKICEYIKEQTHSKESHSTGNTFKLNEKELSDEKLTKLLKLGCAYSRLKVDNNSLMSEISHRSIFSISNLYSMKFWIPMRLASNPLVWTKSKAINTKVTTKKNDGIQTSINFE